MIHTDLAGAPTVLVYNFPNGEEHRLSKKPVNNCWLTNPKQSEGEDICG